MDDIFKQRFGEDAYVQRPTAQGFTVFSGPNAAERQAYNDQFMVGGNDIRRGGEWGGLSTEQGASSFPQFMGAGQTSQPRQYYIDPNPSQVEGASNRRYVEDLTAPTAWQYDPHTQTYTNPKTGVSTSVADLGIKDPTTASFEVGRLASLGGKNVDSWSAYGTKGQDWGTSADKFRGALTNDLPKIKEYEAKKGWGEKLMDAYLDYGPQLVLAAATMGAGGLSGLSSLSDLIPSSLEELGMSAAKNAAGQLVTTGHIDPIKLAMSNLPGGNIPGQIAESIGSSLPDIGLGDMGQVGDVLNDAAGNVVKGGVTNLTQGRDPFANVGTNALTGTVNSVTGNYLPSTGDQTTDQIIQNAVRTGTGAAIRGKDVGQAVGSNLTNSAFNRGVDAIKTGGLNMVGNVRRFSKGGSLSMVRGFDNGGYVDDFDFSDNTGTDYVYDDLGDIGSLYSGSDETGSNMDPSFYSGDYNVDGDFAPYGPTMDDLRTQGDAEMDRFNANPSNANEYDKLVNQWMGQYGITSPGYGQPGNATRTAGVGGGMPKTSGGINLSKLLDPGNAAALATLLNAVKGGTKPFTQSATAARPASLLDQPLRSAKPLTVNAYQGDFTKYGQPGQGGEHQFFNPVKAACGGHMAGGGGLGNMLAHYVQGGSSGQADDVPAMLSHGEYVIDADTVSSLGDGNNAAGAKALDRFIQKVRAQKRSAPISKIPPKAKPVQHYMKKGK